MPQRMNENSPPRSGIITFLQQFWGQLWRYMVAGLLVWLPLIITIWVSWLVIQKLVFGIEDVIRQGVMGLHLMADRFPGLGFFNHVLYRPGLGFLIVLGLFLTTGFLTRYIVGRKVIEFGERILHQIPIIRPIYRAVQQIRDTFIGHGRVFQHVCLIAYPREGMLAVAFVMSTEQGDIQMAAGQELLAVFVPTTPNPTSGYLVYVPPRDVTLLDMSVEDAMKLIVSGGAYIPGTVKGGGRSGEELLSRKPRPQRSA